MNLWHIFLAFFIPGILGYGGGPASIPLVENEVANTYGWMNVSEFSRVLALGNSLPGPIATKLAGYIGFAEGGILGGLVAIIATVGPSLILMIALMRLLYKYKDSPKVKQLTLLIRPTIAVLLGLMAYQFFQESIGSAGWIQTGILIVASYLLLERLRVHPAFVIAGALAYGALFLGA
ncbi:chromate transporter [Tuberibacillus sp. Marseille-P3662]|uniref:chromate transporter n=1 Tax=Tuberibacillus sp. Marseille-P3662 TaxID=1965358 RepID=UPI000A1CCDCE|nr:chromate transporter [Tuberibacillus sp. Marseille-P3662]